MKQIFLFVGLLIVSAAGLAQKSQVNKTPSGTGRVGSAEAGKSPQGARTPFPFTGLFGPVECQYEPKVFTIDDADTSFKNIIYANGKIRIESNTNEPVEIDCEKAKKGKLDKTQWINARQLKEKRTVWDVVSSLNLSGKGAQQFILTNNKEIPVESLINVYAPENSNKGATIVLKYKNWNGKSLQIDCPSSADEFQIQVTSSKGTQGRYEVQPIYNAEDIKVPVPPGQCPVDEYYKFDMAKGTIDLAPKKSVTLPGAIPEPPVNVGAPVTGGVR